MAESVCNRAQSSFVIKHWLHIGIAAAMLLTIAATVVLAWPPPIFTCEADTAESIFVVEALNAVLCNHSIRQIYAMHVPERTMCTSHIALELHPNVVTAHRHACMNQ